MCQVWLLRHLRKSKNLQVDLNRRKNWAHVDEAGLQAHVEMPGFNYDLARRNAYLQERGVKFPGFTKTGTTIAGVIYKVIYFTHTRKFSILATETRPSKTKPLDHRVASGCMLGALDPEW